MCDSVLVELQTIDNDTLFVNPRYITCICAPTDPHVKAKWQMWVVGDAGYGTMSFYLNELPEALLAYVKS